MIRQWTKPRLKRVSFGADEYISVCYGGEANFYCAIPGESPFDVKDGTDGRGWDGNGTADNNYISSNWATGQGHGTCASTKFNLTTGQGGI